MTSELWSGSPQFAQGQYFSAEMHGNALIQCAEVLMGVYKGPQCLWRTSKGAIGNAGGRFWSGAVRHKANGETLAYKVRVWRDGDAHVVSVKGPTTATHTVTAGSGYSDVSGSIDVSGLTANTFYQVFVDISNTPTAQVLYLYETDAQTYAALAAFTAGSTPTAAQWAALSTRADTLWQQATEPAHAVFGAYHTHQVADIGEQETGRWTMLYNNRYLAYQFRVRTPGNTNQTYLCTISVRPDMDTDGGIDDGLVVMLRKGWYVTAHEYDTGVTRLEFKDVTGLEAGVSALRMLHGSEIVKLGTDNGDNSYSDCVRGYNETTAQLFRWECHEWQQVTDSDEWERESEPGYVLFRGVIDLNTLGLTEGDLYEVTASAYNVEHGEISVDTSGFGIDYLYTVSASTPYTPGWATMASFSRGSTVTGAGSIKPVRDNLTWLSASNRIVYRNWAAPDLQRWGGYGVRQKRWLVYYCTDKDQQPEIVYWTTTKEKQVVGLTNKPNEWVSYDLDAAEGLWDGVGYHLRGVTYAMEDDLSV